MMEATSHNDLDEAYVYFKEKYEYRAAAVRQVGLARHYAKKLASCIRLLDHLVPIRQVGPGERQGPLPGRGHVS